MPVKHLLRAALLSLIAAPALAAAPAVKWAMVTQTAGTGTPTFTQDFTDATAFGGNAPEFALCWSAGTSTTDTGQAGYAFAMGAIADGVEGSVAILGPDAVSPTAYAYGNKTTFGYHHVNSAGNVDGSANLSLIANGVRFSWTDQSVGETITCLMGDNEIEASLVSHASTNVSTEQTVTHGLSGTPDLIIAWGVGQATGDNNGAINPGIGFWTSGAEVGFSQQSQNGQTTTAVTARASSTTAMNRIGTSTTFAYTGDISNVTSSSFGLTYSANHTQVNHFLSIRSTTDTPLYVKAGNFTTRTTTGTQADVTGMSGAPQVLLTIGTQLTAMDTGSSADLADAMSFGASVKNTGTGSTQYGSAAVSDNDNTTASSAHACNQWSNTVGLNILATNCATDVAASVSSWDSAGVTHNYTTNGSAVAAQVLYLAFGGAAPVAPTFSVAPAIGTRTTSSIPVTATTACTDCTFHGVAVTDGTAAPTCAQIDAETASGAYKYFHQSLTATVEGTGTFSTYTDGTVRDGYFCLESTANGYSASVSSIANMYKKPAFSAAPIVTSQTDVAYTVSKTLDGAGSVSLVACPKDATAPSAAQVGAQEFCGDGVTDVAAAASDDATGTVVLGGSLINPVYDIYVIGTYGSQTSDVTALVDECLDAPSGKQLVNCPTGLTSIHANSPINGFNTQVTPDIAVGDIPIVDAVTTPGGCAVTPTATGLYSYPGSCGPSKQAHNWTFYDLSVAALHADTLRVCTNNQPPTALSGEYQWGMVKDQATSVAFDDLFADADDAGRTYTTSASGAGTGADKYPTGMAIDGDGSTGTPTSATGSSGSYRVTRTDDCGASASLDVFWTVTEQSTVPDVVGDALADALTALEAANLEGTFTSHCSSTVPALEVISQSPAASAVVNPFTEVSLVVSSGACGRAYKRLGLNTELRM